jgi:hypothetical protein
VKDRSSGGDEISLKKRSYNTEALTHRQGVHLEMTEYAHIKAGHQRHVPLGREPWPTAMQIQ